MVKRRFVIAGIAGLAAMVLPLISISRPQPINQLYIFGDSLSDTGVAFQLSGGSYPPPPYYQGRFSNGRVWVEYLAEALKLSASQISNFACGGATTGATSNSPVPSLLTQIQTFTQAHSSASADALYIIWAGANDYLQGASSATASVENIKAAIATLISGGAQRILVANLPNLGQLPGTRHDSRSKALNELAQSHNQALRRVIKQLSQQQTGIQIASMDVNTLYRDAVTQPAQFGLSNVTSACLVGSQVCGQPDQFLFWDDIHPTTTAHRVMAEAALKALQEGGLAQAWPNAASA